MIFIRNQKNTLPAGLKKGFSAKLQRPFSRWGSSRKGDPQHYVEGKKKWKNGKGREVIRDRLAFSVLYIHFLDLRFSMFSARPARPARPSPPVRFFSVFFFDFRFSMISASPARAASPARPARPASPTSPASLASQNPLFCKV